VEGASGAFLITLSLAKVENTYIHISKLDFDFSEDDEIDVGLDDFEKYYCDGGRPCLLDTNYGSAWEFEGGYHY
jgi:hypothetical protein